MPVPHSTYFSWGELHLCKLGQAEMLQGAARFKELHHMIYHFYKDLTAGSDDLQLSQRLPCNIVQASCTFVLILL